MEKLEAEAVDEIAERVVSLGGYAIATFSELQAQTTLKPGDSKLSSQKMLADLLSDHQTIVDELRDIDKTLPEADETTLTLLSDRMSVHELDWCAKLEANKP